MPVDDVILLDGGLDAAEVQALRTQNEQLTEALKSKRIIGAAIGIIMATTKVSYEQGFKDLSIVSQHRNVKLRAIAEPIVLTGEVPQP